jgi:hypothetical protein
MNGNSEVECNPTSDDVSLLERFLYVLYLAN